MHASFRLLGARQGRLEESVLPQVTALYDSEGLLLGGVRQHLATHSTSPQAVIRQQVRPTTMYTPLTSLGLEQAPSLHHLPGDEQWRIAFLMGVVPYADADRTAAEPSMGREGRTGRPTPSGLLDDGQFSEAQDDHCEGVFCSGPDESLQASLLGDSSWPGT